MEYNYKEHFPGCFIVTKWLSRSVAKDYAVYVIQKDQSTQIPMDVVMFCAFLGPQFVDILKIEHVLHTYSKRHNMFLLIDNYSAADMHKE